VAREFWVVSDEIRLSCYVMTLNSERRLAAVLNSVRGVADEIVVVDSGSKDQTQEIAADHGARFLCHAFVDFKRQRTFALEQCASLWVLELDSDEVLSTELRDRLLALKASGFRQGTSAPDAFGIRRRWFLLGREVRCFYPSRCPDLPIRLFRKDKVTYNQSRGIHEALSGFQSSRPIEEPILHFTCDSIEQMYAKMELYTTLAAREMAANGERATTLKLILYPWALWFRWYILLGGWRDGRLGLVHGRYVRDTVYQKYLKLKFDHPGRLEAEHAERHLCPNPTLETLKSKEEAETVESGTFVP
jgi:glycosyltransferase involved in cell wall biosynthesis